LVVGVLPASFLQWVRPVRGGAGAKVCCHTLFLKRD
jgi:hypothetical protein